MFPGGVYAGVLGEGADCVMRGIEKHVDSWKMVFCADTRIDLLLTSILEYLQLDAVYVPLTDIIL